MSMNITQLANGILFETPGADGVHQAKKVFVPKSFINISKISLFNTHIVGQNRDGVDMMFNYVEEGQAATEGIIPVATVGGTPVTSNENLFNLFIAIT